MTGQKPLGSPSTYLRKLGQAVRTGEVRVPCGSCRACCTSPDIHVELEPREVSRFKDSAVHKAGEGWQLAKKADGSCVHLIEGRCAIYATRPAGCRLFDCRLQALFGAPSLDPVMDQAVRQWSQPRMPLPEDREALLALRLALADQSMATGSALVKALRWRDHLPRARALLAALDGRA
jgi:Putative zinc- or iron-chelating domain